ncbi:unnamed protein product, partial [Prorocentrum cordatum]
VVAFVEKPRPDGGFGLQSISDFASVFKESDYEDNVGQDILQDVQQHNEFPVVFIARRRTAWQLAGGELAKACKKRVEGAPDPDWDTPLGQEEEDKRKDKFKRACDDYRCALRLMCVCRARIGKKPFGGVALACSPRPRLPDLPLSTALRVLWALRLQCNCWAIAGASLVGSKQNWGEEKRACRKVRECHVSDAQAYYDFVYRKAMEHKGPEPATVAWLIDRDRAARAKAKSLCSAGWPWAEALQGAKDLRSTITCSGTGVSRQVSVAMPANDEPESDGDDCDQGGA